MFKIIYRMRKNRSGFTLIELMMVVAILGILASLAVASFGDTSSEKAKLGKIKGDLRTIESALTIYKLDKGSEPSTINSLVPDYLKKVPSSPVTGYSYAISGSTAVLENDDTNAVYILTIGTDSFECSSANL